MVLKAVRKLKPRSFQTIEKVTVSLFEMIPHLFRRTTGALLCALALFNLVGVASTLAQVSEREDFFGKDFASSPMAGVKVNEDSPNPKPDLKPVRQPIRPFDDRRSPIQNRSSNPAQQRVPDRGTIPHDRLIQDAQPKSGDGIIKISVVVNSLDRAHFDGTIRELVSVAKKRKIQIGSVMHIGDYRAITPSIEAAIKGVGGSIAGISTPPAEYGVETSPAWIMATPNGEIVLEGVRAVGLYIDGGGNFVEKPIVPDRAPEIEVRGEF